MELIDVTAASQLAEQSVLGTHVDHPPDAIELLVGPATVADARAARGVIDHQELGALVVGVYPQRLLFRTSRSGGLTLAAARMLTEMHVQVVGIDQPSIGTAAMRELRARDVVVIEGLDLSAAGAGRYQLLCLPARVTGSGPAPARALLVSDA